MTETTVGVSGVWQQAHHLVREVQRDLEAATDCYWRRDTSEAKRLNGSLATRLSQLEAVEEALTEAVCDPGVTPEDVRSLLRAEQVAQEALTVGRAAYRIAGCSSRPGTAVAALPESAEAELRWLSRQSALLLRQLHGERPLLGVEQPCLLDESGLAAAQERVYWGLLHGMRAYPRAIEELTVDLQVSLSLQVAASAGFRAQAMSADAFARVPSSSDVHPLRRC